MLSPDSSNENTCSSRAPCHQRNNGETPTYANSVDKRLQSRKATSSEGTADYVQRGLSGRGTRRMKVDE